MAKEKFDLEKIKNIEWRYLVNRREALFGETITDGSYKYFKKVTGINWEAMRILRISKGEVFNDSKELDKLQSIFIKGGVKLFQNFSKNLIFYVQNLDNITSKIRKVKPSLLTVAQLNKLLNQYTIMASYAHNFLTPMPVADKAISQIILDNLPTATDKEKQKWLSILTYPIKENSHTKEQRSFFQLAYLYKKNSDEFNCKLDAHLKKFRWIGARNYWWKNIWIKNDLLKRLDNFLKQNKNPKNELQYLNNIRQERKQATDILLKKFNIKKGCFLYELIYIAKEYSYLRTWRTDVIYRASYKVRGIFYEIARRSNFNKNNMSYLSVDEVLTMAKVYRSPISLLELKRRKEFYALVTLNRKIYILSGRIWKKRLSNIIKKALNLKKEKIIKGAIAYKGITKGYVKIVLQNENIKDVKQGDILVTVMTFPNFIPAMEKAAAFITDEGGILCHAAIVAREMNKPCIIGTKIATKVLKDGDLVEVDADKGIVKILKRAKK